MSDAFIIRRARRDDRAAMERICAHTWDDGDYIPYVWDRWLADEQGPLEVGEIAGRVVALSKITFFTAGEAWLQGMRVDPDYRQRGIGSRFLEHNLGYARDHGARVARLSTSIRNTPVHAMMARAGMERIGTYVFWQAGALPGGPEPSVLSAGDQEAVEAFLRTSPVLGACHGVFGSEWAWQDLSPEQIASLLTAGRVVALPSPGGPWPALAVLSEDREDSAVDVGFADGDHSTLHDLAMALRSHAARLDADWARAWLPEVDWLREAFASAGYAFGEWRGEMCLYERVFSPASRGQALSAAGGRAG